MDTLAQLELLADNQKQAIRWYVSFAVVLLSSGVVLILVMVFAGHRVSPEPFRTVLGIAASFVSSVSVVPLKELKGCRDRMVVYQRLSRDLRKSPPAQKERIEQLAWDAIRKVAVG
jgi:cell shape-determining protein MreC